MKHITLITLTLITLTCHAQTKMAYYKCTWGIKGGVAASWFSGGEASHKGMSHNYESITAGIFAKGRHLQAEVLYSQGGARNPKEGNRTFKTYNIVLPVTYIAHLHDCNLQAGMYVSR